MKYNIQIAVLGGGGRTGIFLVRQLIDEGYHVKVLLRNPDHFNIQSPLIEIIKGDATDADAINILLKGCGAVLSTIGQRPGEPLVAEKATENVLTAMAHYRIKRYILVAGLNIDTPFDRKSEETIASTNWMKSKFPIIQEDRQKAYIRLSLSDVDWTMVRVPFIEYTDRMGEVIVNLEDSPGTKISAGNIAGFLSKQLLEDAYIRKSPFIANS